MREIVEFVSKTIGEAGRKKLSEAELAERASTLVSEVTTEISAEAAAEAAAEASAEAASEALAEAGSFGPRVFGR